MVGLCVGFCGRLGEGWPTCDTQIKSSNSQMDGLGSIRKNNRHSFHLLHMARGEADSIPGHAFAFPFADVRCRRMKAWGCHQGSPYSSPR